MEEALRQSEVEHEQLKEQLNIAVGKVESMKAKLEQHDPLFKKIFGSYFDYIE